MSFAELAAIESEIQSYKNCKRLMLNELYSVSLRKLTSSYADNGWTLPPVDGELRSDIEAFLDRRIADLERQLEEKTNLKFFGLEKEKPDA
jgi:hypothetical protein